MSTPEDLWAQLKAIAITPYGTGLTREQAERIVREVANYLHVDPKVPPDALDFYASELVRMAATGNGGSVARERSA